MVLKPEDVVQEAAIPDRPVAVLAAVAHSKDRAQLAQAARQRRMRESARRSLDDADAAAQGRLEPTPERKTHGHLVEQTVTATDEEVARAGAKVRRVQPPVERYFRRDLITQRQYEAAEDLRADFEFGVVGAHNSGPSLIRVGGSQAGYSAAQLDAATRYRQAVQAIGKSASAIVLPVVMGLADGGEITVQTLAKRRAENEKKVMGAFGLALDILADHYAAGTDRQRAAKYAERDDRRYRRSIARPQKI